MSDPLTLNISSSISRQIKDQALKKGGLIGAFGAFTLIIAGTFLPLDVIKLFGTPILICSLLFITIGLRPYRQLTRLELKPHKLKWDGKGICFEKMGKPLFYIKEHTIAHISWQSHGTLYGLAVNLKRPIDLVIYDKHLDIAGFLADSAERFEGCDLFLPFFTQATAEQWLSDTGLNQVV